MKTMGAAKFKAQCLAVMDEVQVKREPVAMVVPAEEEDDPLAVFRTGSFCSNGDVISPAVDLNEWKALR